MSGKFLILLLIPVALIGQTTHFTFKAITGVSANIAITTAANPNVSGVPLEVGDEIGVFNTSGRCCGAVVWQKINTAITVWGDDSMTPEVDGFREGEKISFKIWVKKTNKEYVATVRYNTAEPFKSGFFSANGTYFLLDITGTNPSGGIENIQLPDNIKVYPNFPNPFNPATKFKVDLPGKSDVSIVILDISGKIIRNLFNSSLYGGDYIFEWNGKSDHGDRMASGVYFYRIQTGEKSFTGKMIYAK